MMLLAGDGVLLLNALREEIAATSDRDNLFSEVEVLDHRGRRRRQDQSPRGKQRKRFPERSRFQQYLDAGEEHRDTLDSIWSESTWEGKQFRRRFRLPFAMFDELCNKYEDIDGRNSRDAFNNPKSNIRLLIAPWSAKSPRSISPLRLC